MRSEGMAWDAKVHIKIPYINYINITININKIIMSNKINGKSTVSPKKAITG
jgi:hypothetical protein